MIEHNIAIVVDHEFDKDLLRAWYKAVVNNAPAGVIASLQVDGKPVSVVKSKAGSEVKYMVPLTRDLSDDEVKGVIDTFSHNTDIDFKVSQSVSPLSMELKPEVEIAHDPMIALCTGWAKKKHEDWMSNKTGSGWRYGPTVSPANKTHPLLRPWEDIPAEYRKVDTTQAQALMDLLRDSGYAIIHHDDLDKLMGDGGF